MDNKYAVKSTKWQQLSLLLYKQTLLFRRNIGVSLVKLLTPIIMMSLYIICFRAANSKGSVQYFQPENLLKTYKTQSDHLLAYNNADVPNFQPLLENIASFLDLNVDEIIELPSSNVTQYTMTLGKADAVSFYAVMYFNMTSENQITYQLVYNYRDLNYPNPMLFMASQDIYNYDLSSEEFQYIYTVQIAIESSIAKYFAGEQTQINVKTKQPPSNIESASIVSGSNILQLFLPTFVYIGYTIPFIVFLQQIVDEKERKIRSYFRTFGVSDEIYLLSWYLEGIFLALYTTMVIMIFGYSSNSIGTTVFLYTSPRLMFIVLITYGLTLYATAVLFSSFMSKSKGAVILGVVIFLFGLLYSIFASLFGSLMYYLWSGKPYFITILIDILPTSNFVKIFTDIQSVVVPSILSSIIPSDSSSSGNLYTQYYWSNFKKSLAEPVNKITHIPSAYGSLNILFFTGLLFIFLAWYLDKIVPSEFGGRRKWNFIFTEEYWFPKNYLKTFSEYDLTGRDRTIDPDLEGENVSVNPQNAHNHSLVIRNLYKSFGAVPAVNGLNLSVEKGKILSLLGHNGCGKTTTVNMITGQTTIDSGLAVVHGYDARDQMHNIHSLIGVCPQFDVYWPNFTAREHLYIMTQLKEQRKDIERDIDEILKSVRLSSVGNNYAGSYSGGMRRRLSVAMAMIGSPQVIILDEPTTGIDVANRSFIWRLIKSIKKDRLIILTTHSMEEAEALGDKIAIMNKGKLYSIGTSLHLKERYSSGMKLNLITTNVEECRVFVQSNIRSALLDKINSNNISFSISNLDDLTSFLRFLSQDEKSQQLITDWQIQNTSLEDVFLRVVRS